jgi:hypothetical protein
LGDPVLEPLLFEALQRLRHITGGRGDIGSADDRDRFASWVADAIAPRNIAGLADASRHNLYPVDLELLIDRHALLGMRRDEMLDAVRALRGMAAEPSFLE